MASDLEIGHVARAGELEYAARGVFHQCSDRFRYHLGFRGRHGHIAEGADGLAFGEASIQLCISGMSGETTLARRRIAAGKPCSMRSRRAVSTRTFCRPYSVIGEYAASGATFGTLPSNTWFVERNSTGMPRAKSRSASTESLRHVHVARTLRIGIAVGNTGNGGKKTGGGRAGRRFPIIKRVQKIQKRPIGRHHCLCAASWRRRQGRAL